MSWKDVEDACAIRDEIKPFIRQTLADEGSSMDTGGGFGSADLWFTAGGTEYLMNIKPISSKKAIAPSLLDRSGE